MEQPNFSAEGAKGLEALQQGNIDDAFNYLSLAVTQESVDNRILFAMAYVARAKSEFNVCLKNIDRYLQNVPQDINANIIKGDALTGLKKHKTAAGFYMAAIQLVDDINKYPEHQANEILRAKKACELAQKTFEKEMQSCLSSIPKEDKQSGSRIGQALDIMMGKKEVHLQQPTKFYFPELPQIQFYNTELFHWAAAIKENIAIIQSELNALLTNTGAFKPYISHNPIAPTIGKMGLNESQDWSSFHFVQAGKEITENIAQCPKTYELISTSPIARIPGKSPNILFSKLAPGAHIPPHHGHMNVRLLCHLPLIVPDGCQLRVGNQTRDVVEGEWMIFDDSIEHEAFNRSQQDRVVLIFDIWRPELSEREIETLSTIFKQINDLE